MALTGGPVGFLMMALIVLLCSDQAGNNLLDFLIIFTYCNLTSSKPSVFVFCFIFCFSETRRGSLTNADVPFPPAAPTSLNLCAICQNGHCRPIYPPSLFSQSSASHFRRRGNAINRLESWYSLCCGKPETQKLCCVQQAVSTSGAASFYYLWLIHLGLEGLSVLPCNYFIITRQLLFTIDIFLLCSDLDLYILCFLSVYLTWSKEKVSDPQNYLEPRKSN